MNRIKTVICALIAVSLILVGCGKNDNKPGETPSAARTTLPARTAVSNTPPETASASEETPSATAKPDLSILFINVGRADSILVQAGGKSYLIDTGTKESVPALYRGLSVCGVTQLDGLFLTHTDNDHVGGSEALAKKCKIDVLYSAEISMNENNGKNRIDEIADSLSLAHKKLKAKERIEIGGGSYFEVLGPIEFNSDEDNDNSLVMKLHAGGITVLFTGDMQFTEENTLLTAETDLSADVLKVADHGNNDATSDDFAKAVGARYAIVSTDRSVDKNTPAERVIEALGDAELDVTQDYYCGILLTASAGSISVSDPKLPEASADISIQGINTKMQTITLSNNGGDTDISGYFILSTIGNEVFVFPEGAVMKGGQALTVACKGGSGDFIWDANKKVWDGKEDGAILYDAFGNVISQFY